MRRQSGIKQKSLIVRVRKRKGERCRTNTSVEGEGQIKRFKERGSKRLRL